MLYNFLENEVYVVLSKKYKYLIYLCSHLLKCFYFILSGEEKFQMRKSLGKNAETLTKSQFQPIRRYMPLFYSQFQIHRSNVNWW